MFKQEQNTAVPGEVDEVYVSLEQPFIIATTQLVDVVNEILLLLYAQNPANSMESVKGYVYNG